MKNTILLVLLLICHITNAEDSDQIKELKAKIVSSVDTVKVIVYSDLCYEYRFVSQDSAIAYGRSAIELATKIGFTRGQAQGCNDLGIIYSDKDEFDSALILYQKALLLRITLDDSAGQASLHNKIGIVYQKKGDLPKAMKSQMQALKFYELMNHPYGTAQCLNNVAIIYYNQGNLDDALEYYQQSLQIKRAIGDQYGMAGTLANIGNIHYSRKNFEKAITTTKESIKYLSELGANEYLASGLNNLGAMQRESGMLDEALLSIESSIAIRQTLNDPKGLASCNINLSSLAIELGQYKKAEDCLAKAALIVDEFGLLLEKRQLLTSYKDLYRKQGQYQQALDASDQLLVIHDSIFNNQSNEKILELQTQYETEKKEKEISLLSAENTIQQLQLQTGRYMILAIGLIAFLIVIFLVTMYSRRHYKLKVKLAAEQANNQKQGFKALIEGEEKERKRIAQELHDGLGQLLSSARLNVSAMEDNFKEVVTTQWNNSLKLIDDAVTEVRQISHNMMPNALISIGFEAALREQIHIINDAGQVKVHATFPDDKIVIEEAEAIALYRIIQELLNNALKYAQADNIWLTINDVEQLAVTIKDDGRGFDTDDINRSTGIGWRNIHSRVDIMNGVIDIRSNKGKGSEISLIFNVRKTAV